MASAKEKKRIDIIEYKKRIRVVYDWILQDHITSDIVQQCVANWNISERQAFRYINEANKLFEDDNVLSIKQKAAYYLSRKKKLLRDMNPGEKKTAAGVVAINKVLDSMARLEGITVDTLKLIGDPDQPIHSHETVEHKIDYSDLSEQELLTLQKIHAKAAGN